MASLDDLKKRISSVKSTQKITKAMKMVAAAKLKRAQDSAEKGRPYSQKMNNVILNLSSGISDKSNAPKLLSGTGNEQIHLCVVMTSDRGLCGGFNANIIKQTVSLIKDTYSDKTVSVLSVGKKSSEYFRNNNYSVISTHDDIFSDLTYDNVAKIAEKKGIKTITKFFSSQTAKEFVENDKKADLLIAFNVLPHTPNLNDFVEGLKILLDSKGLLIVQFSAYLMNLIEQNEFDMIFIDADKMNYKQYYEKSLELIKKGGLIIIDNVLWHGEVADEKNNDKFTINIREFNKLVNEDSRVEQIIMPLGDGMTICRVL